MMTEQSGKSGSFPSAKKKPPSRRPSNYESEGRTFESFRARHLKTAKNSGLGAFCSQARIASSNHIASTAALWSGMFGRSCAPRRRPKVAKVGKVIHAPGARLFGGRVRLASIDTLRGIAALAVVFSHAYGFTLGMIGVDVFFVISGFVIYYAGQGRTPAQFLKARFWRIFPLYWIAVTPWVLSSIARGTMTGERFFTHYALLPFAFDVRMPLLVVAWTLVFECLFYVAAATAMHIRSALPPLAIYAVALLAWSMGGPDWLRWTGNPLIFEFLLGVAVAILPKSERIGRWALAGGAAWLLNPVIISEHEFQFFETASLRVFEWGVAAALIVYGLVSMEHRLKGRAVAFFCFFGTASYSIYLFHALITELVQANPTLRFAMALGSGLVGWFLFERTIQLFTKRRRRLEAVKATERMTCIATHDTCADLGPSLNTCGQTVETSADRGPSRMT